MKYLQIYDEHSVYNTSIGENAYYDVFPNVSIISGDTKNPKFLKYPKHTVTYENFDNGILKNGCNVKRVWNDGKIMYENPFDMTQQQVTVTSNDFNVNSMGFPINVNRNIVIKASIVDKVSLTCENGINENDEIHLFCKFPYNQQYQSEWMGLSASVSNPGVYELINGQIVWSQPFFMNLDSYNEWFMYIFDRTTRTMKPTTINFIGPFNIIETKTENRGENLATLPGDKIISYITLTSLTELDDKNHGFFLRNDVYSEVIPVWLAKEYGLMTDNQTLYFPIMAQIGDDNIECGFCEVTYIDEDNWSQEVTSFIDCDITICAEIPSADSIDTSKFTSTEVTFEVFNRFYPLYWKGSNIKNGDENWLKQVRIIPSQCFSGCTYLTEINIPKSVTEIQENAFANCTNLTKITLPNTLTTLHGDAFDFCASLKNITSHTTFDNNVNFNGWSGMPNGGIIRVPEGTDMNYLTKFVEKGWEIKFI